MPQISPPLYQMLPNSLILKAFDGPILITTHPRHILHKNSQSFLIVVSKATVVLDYSLMVQVLQQLYLTLQRAHLLQKEGQES